MSYEKVKCITRKPKEGKIFITSACNNVRPLTFGKWEYGKADMSYKEKMFYLLKDISGGNLQLNNSCYEWNYAVLKTRDYMQEKYGKEYYLYDLATMKYTSYCLGEQISSQYTPITQTEIESGNYDYILEWESKDNKSKIYYRAEEYNNEKARVMEVLEEYYNVFIGYLEEKHKGKYYLYSETYGYVKPKGTNGSFYYNMSSNLVENMDYKKAYCLARTIGRDIEIKAVPKREYKPTKEQIAESKKRIELLGLEPRFSDKLYMSDRYYIREVKDGEMDLIRAINNFEKNYNAYVYHIIYTKSNFGNLYSMLYVSNNTEEWKADRKDLQNKECYAYVYNKSDEVCSEIGLIGVEKADTNLLTRTF